MTKEQALNQFFSSFGYPAYKENSVKPGAEFPYITYQVSTSSFGDQVPLVASIYDRVSNNHSAGTLNDIKEKEISDAVGRGGAFVDFDGNSVWIQRGTPFSQDMGDPSDPLIRRKLLNFIVEYFSAD